MSKIIRKIQLIINQLKEKTSIYNEIDKIEDEEERLYVKTGLEDGWLR